MIHRKEIDGLRAVAVLPVILWHAGFSVMSGGFAGVDVFFVISGFLITSILIEDMAAGRYSIWNFYERRARRILPALFVVLLASFPFGWLWLAPDQFLGFVKSILATIFFVSNIHFWLATDYFSPAADHLPLLHTWSLSVEEQFYLLFPPLLFVLWRWARRWILPALVGAALISFVGMEILRHDHADPVFFLAPTRAWELLAGSILALVQARHGRAADLGQARPTLVAQILSATGLVMIGLSFVLYDDFTPSPSFYILLPVIGTILVLAWGRQGTLAATLLSLRPLTAIGAISYSAYLWHQPILAFARIRLAEDLSGPLALALSALSLALAALSWRFVEQPMRRSGPQGSVSLRRFTTVVGMAAAGLVLIASLGIWKDLTPYRLPAPAVAQIEAFTTLTLDRQQAIRGGKCHFSASRFEGGIESFLAQWACRPSAAEGMVATRVAIYGDSHAADVAASLRLSGFDVLQLGGAHCSLVPDRMTPTCRRLADFLKAEIGSAGMKELWLANQFDREELTPAALGATLDFWSSDGVRLTLLSPMPEFDNFQNKVIAARWRDQSLILRPDMSGPEAFFQVDNQALFAQRGVAVLDSGALFCVASGLPDCGPVDGTMILMTDGHHLTVEGARRFGAALLAQTNSLMP